MVPLACFLLFVASAFSAELKVACEGGNCANKRFYVIEGQNNPVISCDNGESITFQINTPGHPFCIKTKQTLGDVDLYSGIAEADNCKDSGTLTLPCLDGTSPLYYQSSSEGNLMGGMICLKGPCNADICISDYCWTDPMGPTNPTPKDVRDFISNRAEEFVFAFESDEDVISEWKFDAGWTLDPITQEYKVPFTYVSRASEGTTMNRINSALTEGTKLSVDWFHIDILGDGHMANRDVEGILYIVNPESPDDGPDSVGGYIDVYFYSSFVATGTASPQCTDRERCRRYWGGSTYNCNQYEEKTLVGSFSGNNHIMENDCIPGLTPAWGYIRVNINAQRDGGVMELHCDDNCRRCELKKEFRGDQCTCYIDPEGDEAEGFRAYCMTVDFAASSYVVPSLVALLASLFVLFQ